MGMADTGFGEALKYVWQSVRNKGIGGKETAMSVLF